MSVAEPAEGPVAFTSRIVTTEIALVPVQTILR